MGQQIEDISLEIKDGEVIKGSAKKGKELLDKILEIPGAKRFGEAAIGMNKGINKFNSRSNGRCRFYVTDDAEGFARQAKRFLGYKLSQVKRISNV